MTGWYLRFELCEPVPDDQMATVRQLLLDTLEQAGFPAKSTTAEWSLVELARTAPERFRERAVGRTVLPVLAGKGRKIA